MRQAGLCKLANRWPDRSLDPGREPGCLAMAAKWVLPASGGRWWPVLLERRGRLAPGGRGRNNCSVR
jgi:hypothetical protein